MLFGGHKCLPGSDLPCCAAPDHHARHAVYSGRNARTAAPAHTIGCTTKQNVLKISPKSIKRNCAEPLQYRICCRAMRRGAFA